MPRHVGPHGEAAGWIRRQKDWLENSSESYLDRGGELLGKNVPYCAGSGTQILVYGWRSD